MLDFLIENKFWFVVLPMMLCYNIESCIYRHSQSLEENVKILLTIFVRNKYTVCLIFFKVKIACKWYFGCAVGSIDKLWFTAVWFTIYSNWFTAVAELQINAIASPLSDVIRFTSHC